MVDVLAVLGCLALGADPALISAVITVESQWDHAAINVNKWSGNSYRTKSVNKNAAAARVFVQNGYTVDVGLMQINSNNLKKYEVDILDGFDICTNVQLGERILLDAIDFAKTKGMEGDQAVKAGLSIYNTGSIQNGFSNGYVNKVWGAFENGSEYTSRTSDTNIDLAQSTDMFDYSSNLIVEFESHE